MSGGVCEVRGRVGRLDAIPGKLGDGAGEGVIGVILQVHPVGGIGDCVLRVAESFEAVAGGFDVGIIGVGGEHHEGAIGQPHPVVPRRLRFPGVGSDEQGEAGESGGAAARGGAGEEARSARDGGGGEVERGGDGGAR
eukprot:4072044-Prymnesium_polylepis.1